MALVKALEMTVAGASISIIYNDANNKIQSVDWVIPAPDPPQVGVVARIQIWDENVDPINPAYDRTFGQGSGTENVPGNHFMVEVTEGDQTFLDLPSYIRFRINMETIGP